MNPAMSEVHAETILEELVEAISEILYEEELAGGAMGTSVQRMVAAQSHLLLDRANEDQEDTRIVQAELEEFQAVVMRVQSVVSERIRTYLMETIRRRVREAYQGALDSADIALSVPLNLGVGGDERSASASSHNGHEGKALSDAVSVMTYQTNGHHSNGAGSHSSDGSGPDVTETSAEPELQEEQESSVSLVSMQNDLEDGVYEGTVRLNVEPDGGLKQVAQFVDDLRRKPEFRLLQMVGARHAGVLIWLGLREPVDLAEALLGMDGVSHVRCVEEPSRSAPEPLLEIRLLEHVAVP